MSVDRMALVANGLLVLLSSLLAIAVDTRFGWLTIFMGVSLIFSGATGYCGWAQIFGRIARGR